jgi:triacylglycerol esterase/lipase EstA (alpha/beta hydrolase family)
VSELSNVARVAGRSIGAAALWVSDQAVKAYQTMDPDVPRHLGQLPLLAYTYLSPRRAPVAAVPDDGHPPIILVHGLGAARGCFLPMASYLWLRGRKRTYSIDFGKATTLRQMARRLTTYVRTVQRKTGARRVELVAHSLGGLVARLAIAECGLGDAVSILVTLGSPHLGTHAARFAGTTLTRALRPDSDFLRSLAAYPTPPGVRCVSLWSKNDVLIVPAESAVLAGSEAYEVTPFTHYSYLVSPRAWAAVLDVLEGRPVKALPPTPRRRRARTTKRVARPPASS